MTDQASTTAPIRVKIVNPTDPNRPLSLDIAAQREALANFLRANHPGEWAEVSYHTSRGAARQVRDRMKGRPCWHEFEWAVRQMPNLDDEGNLKPGELHVTFAKAPKKEDTPEVAPQPVIRTLDEISPVF